MKKFILSNQELKKGLHRLGNVVPVKSVLPALTNIHCKVGEKSIEMIGSDLETTIILKLEAETFGDAFEFLLPFSLISKIVALSGNSPLAFSMNKSSVKITGENDAYELKLQKVEDFPKLPKVEDINSIDIEKELIALLKVATLTVGKDENKPAHQKVLLELRKAGVTVASTDGSFVIFSNTLSELSAPADDDLLINPKVIKSIEDIQQAKLTWSEKTISFQGDKVTVLITRPEAKFPNYRRMFPEDFPSNVKVLRQDLVNALEKCNISNDYFKEMKIDLTKKGKLILTANDKESGININVEVPGNYSGQVETIKASSEKMLKLMAQVDYDDIEMAIHDARRPIIFRNEDAGYQGLLMAIHPTP